MECRVLVILVCLFSTAFADRAIARNTPHELDVREAVEHGSGNANLLDIPFYFAGQQHPEVASKIGTWSTNRSTSGVFKSDKNACQRAFLSAVISLQKRAKKEGGDAIVDIVSVTRDIESSSATTFRCVAGATVVHVGLRGDVVKLAK